KLRSEEFDADRISAVGQTNSSRIESGRTFDLKSHPTSSLNTKYLVTAATYQGKQATSMTSAYASGRTNVFDARILQDLIAAQQDQNGHTRTLAEAALQVGVRLARSDPTARRPVSSWLYHAGQTVRDLASAAYAMGG